MLKNLFSPFKIKGKTLKNRTVVPPMVSNYANRDGTCTEMFTAYHEARAKGGFGMIITEDFAVSPSARGFRYLPGLWEDSQIPGYAKFTEKIHQHGALVIAQIYHAGRQSSEYAIEQQVMSASALPCPLGCEMPLELTIEEIQNIVQDFANTAMRAEKAGFDGVEIHGAHGYLISQFMSSYSNKRTDQYGGPIQNRVRFAVEIISEVKKKVSSDFIVGYRISSDYHVPGGLNINDTKAILPYLEDAGIDYIHVSAGVYRSFNEIIPSMYIPHGWNVEGAAEVKKITELPVIAVGRINDPRIAEQVIASGKADLVSFGRQSLADPETPNKAKAGNFDDMRLCIACHHGCVGPLLQHEPIGCILNPYTGHEFEYSVVQTDQPKKVVVIGAGPAGLQAAITAAESGHQVEVYEKDRWAGGQFRLGAVPPAKGEIVDFIVWQLHQLEKLNVPVKFNTEVTKELIDDLKPDVVVAATGATPINPEIIGVGREHVVCSHDVLAGKAQVGPRVVVIGGGTVGSETAYHLASNLKSVTLVELQDDIATDEAIAARWLLLDSLEHYKVRVCTETTVAEIKENSVLLKGKVEEEIPVDTVVISVGAQPNRTLAESLKEAGYDVHMIGDAVEVGLAGEAIEAGFHLGRSL